MAENHYSKLLTGVRGRASRITGRTLVDEAFSDRGRVIFSAPLRRMQNKAQVFSLERNASVRSRLTHSLEVSSIGRFIAQEVVNEMHKMNGSTTAVELDDSFITFVEVACLLHDVGNPPFGHFGEKAIAHWFSHHKAVFQEVHAIKRLGEADQAGWDRAYLDFTKFDGNPQGFRTVSRLQPRWEGDRFGLNLSLTTLAATIKYPWTAATAVDKGKRKFGFFSTEAELYAKIQTTLELAGGQRHPIVYLVEAADDIAYCLSDIEDGLAKKIVTLEELHAHLVEKCAGVAELAPIVKQVEPPYDRILSGDDKHARDEHHAQPFLDPLQELRGGAIRLMTSRAAERYVREHARILSGELDELIDKHGPEGKLLTGLKSFAHAYLYDSDIVRSREITAYRVIHGILDAHRPILTCELERFRHALEGRDKDGQSAPITIEASLLSRIPRDLLVAYRAAQPDGRPEGWREWIDRAHLLTDYVGGMTDEHALECYRLISGMVIDPRL